MRHKEMERQREREMAYGSHSNEYDDGLYLGHKRIWSLIFLVINRNIQKFPAWDNWCENISQHLLLLSLLLLSYIQFGKGKILVPRWLRVWLEYTIKHAHIWVRYKCNELIYPACNKYLRLLGLPSKDTMLRSSACLTPAILLKDYLEITCT